MLCSGCGKELHEGDDVYVCLDNWLNWNHYAEIGPHANVFCSAECFCDDWSVERMTLGEYRKEVVVG